MEIWENNGHIITDALKLHLNVFPTIFAQLSVLVTSLSLSLSLSLSVSLSISCMSTLNLGNPPFVRRGDRLTAASRPASLHDLCTCVGAACGYSSGHMTCRAGGRAALLQVDPEGEHVEALRELFFFFSPPNCCELQVRALLLRFERRCGRVCGRIHGNV